MKWVDLFCIRHPRFGIPNLMRFIIFGNIAVFIIYLLSSSSEIAGEFLGLLSFSPSHVLRGEIWRILTFLFIPINFQPISFLISLVFYYMIARTLEQTWGVGKFTIYYFSGVILTVLFSLLCYLLGGYHVRPSSTFINFSMLFCYATLLPDNYVMLYYVIPIKMKWIGILNAIYFLIAVLTSPFPHNLVPIVAVLNYILFCWDAISALLQRTHRPQNVVSFRREATRIRTAEKHKPYTHKCEVCGKTDIDYPQMSFRYCSRCAGYHCFCEHHINNHTHAQE